MGETYNPDEDGMFVCTECGSPFTNPLTDPFVQSGMMPACKGCGGLCTFVDDPADAAEAVRQHNIVQRNLDL